MLADSVADSIRALPDQPGIYIFKDASGAPLYVGKAKSLRKRAVSYLGEDHEPRLAVMLEEAAEVDFLVTDSESEALLLENNWIKRQQPRYNIRLRDDKTYPYLKLTLNDEYPRIAFTRRIRDDGAEYFGPFLPAGLARKAIKLVQKLFQLRVCSIEIDGRLARPCLYWDMRRCLGPCVDGLTTKAAYDEAVQSARLFLGGKNEELLRGLRSDMRRASDELRFEEAARLRDLTAEIEAIGERRKLSSAQGEELDIYGVHVATGHAAVVVLVMRGGQVLDRRELFWEDAGPVAPRRLLSEVLPQIYDRTSFVPREIHLPMPIDGDEALVAWLSERRGQRVYLRMPSRGPKADRVALAMRNAKLAHRRRFRGSLDPGLAVLQTHLDLAEVPMRIEGFDVSNFQGGETVASLVVFEGGRMQRREYRSFNIRDIDTPNDVAAIHQAVSRRYRRRLEEVGILPDLILIDGGRPQLNAALQALADLGVEETPVVGLAKRDEELYRPDSPAPTRLSRDDAGLKLLQRIRDEAHRIALHHHRRRRSARTLQSRLDDLRGVGPRRKRRLLREFGSYRGLCDASLEEIQRVVGPSLGVQIYQQLHPNAGTASSGGEVEPGLG